MDKEMEDKVAELEDSLVAGYLCQAEMVKPVQEVDFRVNRS